MSSGTIGTKGVPRREREAQILAVAVDEFSARGYAGASVVEVAARAGISKPLIYQYFGSKDGLYLACLRSVGGDLLIRLEAAQRNEDDSVMARVDTLATIFEALEPQRTAWLLLYDTTLPAVGPIADLAADYRHRTAALAARGSERFLAVRGLLDPLDASALSQAWTGIVYSLVTWWIEHPEESAKSMVARIDRVFSAVLD